MLDYLKLFRLPNVFTAVADVWAGFLLMRGAIDGANWGTLAALSVASALLYTAGMVLNDVFDVEIDQKERPERPLPSGRIPLQRAAMIGGAMLLGGVLAAWLAPQCGSPEPMQPLAPAVVAILLAGAVLMYDSWAKKTPLGPLSMGICRGLNLLLGMVAVSPLDPAAVEGAWLGLPPIYFMLPLGATLYITGLTWFARDEAGVSQRGSLIFGLVVLCLGLATIGLFPQFVSATLQADRLPLWLALFALLSLSIIRPFLRAIRAPGPQTVQAAIKHGIFSLITLDAVIAYYGADHALWPLAILALMAPSKIIGHWVYST